MIRLYAEMVRGLLLILAALRAQSVESGREVIDAGIINTLRRYTQDHPDDPLTQWLSGIPWDDTLAQINYDELIGSLKDQLDNQGSGKGDVTLLETITDIIDGPWGSNRLGGETLSALRHAILKPSEIETFRRLSRESFQCSRCEHRFTNAEAVIVMREANNNLSMRCMQCALPCYGVCTKCGDAAPLTSIGQAGVLAAARTVSCDCATRHKKPEAPGPAPGQPIPRRNARERAAQLLAREQLHVGIREAAHQPQWVHAPAQPARAGINGPVDVGMVGADVGWVERMFVDDLPEAPAPGQLNDPMRVVIRQL